MPLPVAWPVTQILYDISPRRLLIFINKCRCFYKDFYVRKYTHTSNWPRKWRIYYPAVTRKVSGDALNEFAVLINH
jgi:hypothetical protein